MKNSQPTISKVLCQTIFLLALLNSCQTVLFPFIPLYLHDIGLTAIKSGMSLSAMHFCGLISCMFIPSCAVYYRRRKPIVLLLMLSCLITFGILCSLPTVSVIETKLVNNCKSAFKSGLLNSQQNGSLTAVPSHCVQENCSSVDLIEDTTLLSSTSNSILSNAQKKTSAGRNKISNFQHRTLNLTARPLQTTVTTEADQVNYDLKGTNIPSHIPVTLVSEVAKNSVTSLSPDKPSLLPSVSRISESFLSTVPSSGIRNETSTQVAIRAKDLQKSSSEPSLYDALNGNLLSHESIESNSRGISHHKNAVITSDYDSNYIDAIIDNAFGNPGHVITSEEQSDSISNKEQSFAEAAKTGMFAHRAHSLSSHQSKKNIEEHRRQGNLAKDVVTEYLDNYHVFGNRGSNLANRHRFHNGYFPFHKPEQQPLPAYISSKKNSHGYNHHRSHNQYHSNKGLKELQGKLKSRFPDRSVYKHHRNKRKVKRNDPDYLPNYDREGIYYSDSDNDSYSELFDINESSDNKLSSINVASSVPLYESNSLQDMERHHLNGSYLETLDTWYLLFGTIHVNSAFWTFVAVLFFLGLAGFSFCSLPSIIAEALFEYLDDADYLQKYKNHYPACLYSSAVAVLMVSAITFKTQCYLLNGTVTRLIMYFLAFLLLMSVTFFALFCTYISEANQFAQQGRSTFKRAFETLLQDHRLTTGLVVIAVIGTVTEALHIFLFWKLQDLGGTDLTMGCVLFVRVIAELPMCYVGKRLVSKFKCLNMLSITLVMLGIKSVCLAFVPNAWAFVIVEFLGIMTNAVSPVIDAFAEEPGLPFLQIKLLTLYTSIYKGIGGTFGGLLAAVLYYYTGWTNQCGILSGLAFITAIIIVLMERYLPRRGKHDYLAQLLGYESDGDDDCYEKHNGEEEDWLETALRKDEHRRRESLEKQLRCCYFPFERSRPSL